MAEEGGIVAVAVVVVDHTIIGLGGGSIELNVGWKRQGVGVGGRRKVRALKPHSRNGTCISTGDFQTLIWLENQIIIINQN